MIDINDHDARLVNQPDGGSPIDHPNAIDGFDNNGDQVMEDQPVADQLQYRHPYEGENEVVENAFASAENQL